MRPVPVGTISFLSISFLISSVVSSWAGSSGEAEKVLFEICEPHKKVTKIHMWTSRHLKNIFYLWGCCPSKGAPCRTQPRCTPRSHCSEKCSFSISHVPSVISILMINCHHNQHKIHHPDLCGAVAVVQTCVCASLGRWRGELVLACGG